LDEWWPAEEDSSMTFPSRGTRKLVVDGRVWLWHIAPTDAESGYGPATIAAAEGSGVLHYWVEQGFPSPREAATIIRFALSAGWDPRLHGQTMWVGKTEQGALFLSLDRTSPR
jgi:hypothetical protein